MTSHRRLLAFGAALTLLFGLLTGIVDALTLRSSLLGRGLTYLDPELSGPAALFGARYVEWVAVPLALAVYLLSPFVIAVVVSRGDDRPQVFHLAWSVAAVAVLPMTLVTAVLLIAGGPRLRWPTLAILVGLSAVLLAIHRVALARSHDHVERRPPLAVFGNVAFVLVFAAGVWLGTVAAGPAGALVDQQEVVVPQSEFAFSETEADDGTVLVITHAGGDPVPAANLRIDGDGFANVSGVNRSEPGGWPRSGTTDGPDGPVVTEDDSVTVGVAGDCTIRVRYVRGATSGTLARHDCDGE